MSDFGFFTCYTCGVTLARTQSVEEAIAEYRETFPQDALTEPDGVENCRDCHNEVVERYQKELN